MIYKIHVTTENGELLQTLHIDPNLLNWDSNPTMAMIGADIIDEIKKAEKRGEKNGTNI